MPRALALVTVLAAAAAAPAQPQDVYLIRPAGGGAVVEPQDGFPPPATRGLLIWSEGDRERTLVLKDDTWRAAAETPLPPEKKAPTGAVAWARTRGDGSAGGSVALAAAVNLPPSSGSVVLRGCGFITPARNTISLADRPVFRRIAAAAPAEVIVTDLTSKKEAARIRFAAGETRTVCPVALPPGRYFAQLPPLESAEFTVAPAADRQRVLARADRVAAVTGATERPVADLVRVEELLVAQDAVGPKGQEVRVPVYLGDVLDAIDAVPPADRSPALTAEGNRVLTVAAFLNGEKAPESAPAETDAPTGVPAIDDARRLIRAGRTREAETLLAAVPAGDGRAAALAALYRAAVAAEAGATRAEEAEDLFQKAAAGLTAQADQFRVHNNAATFFHRQAEDRVSNYALQSAAGVDRPITAALRAWGTANDEYAQALAVAGPADRPAVLANQARLAAILADLVRVAAADNRAADLEKAAVAGADALAAAAMAAAAADPVSRGVAAEVRAHLALRANDPAGCRKYAAAARSAYAAAGFLAGVEGAYRVLGQAALAADDKPAARRDFQIAHELGEVLRDRLPPDQAGATAAGFFARRAYVLDALVELELDAKNDAAALAYAEQAKARALQDLLQARVEGKARTLPDVLASWPADVAAVEYFFGREKGWVFVVSPGGAVKAHPMDADPRKFLTQVQTFLKGIEAYAPKMMSRLVAGRGFDNAWQTTLFEFGKVLTPPPVLAELRKAKTVVVVPQHILHYFPFPALVTALDASNPGTTRVARPAFLADEPFALINAPSLTGWDALRRRSPAGPVLADAAAVGLVQAPGEAALPGVETDLQNLKSAFGPRLRTVLSGDQATAAGALKLLTRTPGIGLVMVATHGFNQADKPLDSFLVLLPPVPDPAAEPDGKLRAKDVYSSKQPVTAGVVVMSACYTGLGDRSPLPGDDLFGLQRAFLTAGARTVLAGLWDVYDGTAPELMGDCLNRLAAGQPVGQAVADSRRAFLKKYSETGKAEPYLHPYFWAVYGLLGDDRPKFAAKK